MLNIVRNGILKIEAQSRLLFLQCFCKYFWQTLNHRSWKKWHLEMRNEGFLFNVFGQVNWATEMIIYAQETFGIQEQVC